MPTIDWTNPGFVFALAVFGAILIVLAILGYFLPPARLKGLALAAGVGGGLAAGIAVGLHLLPAVPAEDRGKSADAPAYEPFSQAEPALTLPVPELVTRFRKMTPAERMTLLARLPDSAAAWYTVQRGDVDSLVELGTLECADNGEVVVKVRARKPDDPVTTIRKVLVDDGAIVKKGDLLVELDDSALQVQLQAQKIAVRQAKVQLTQAQKDLEIEKEEGPLDIKTARHQVTVAERYLRDYKGSDADDKRGLELQLEQARLAVKRRESQAVTKKALAETNLLTQRAILDAETAKLHDIEQEIVNCKMVAPRDGSVIYHVPDQVRVGARQSVLAPDETVREGQKLLSIPDLSKMQVRVRIQESLIPLVHADQSAGIRVDAFPGRVLSGKVVKIGKVPERQGDAKIYPVTVALTDEKLGLMPGMSAEVRLQVKPHRNVLRVPTQALLHDAGKVICFVKSGAEIRERQVSVGLSDKDFIEITNGLTEGDPVLRDPRAVLRRVSWPRRAENAKDKQGARDEAYRAG